MIESLMIDLDRRQNRPGRFRELCQSTFGTPHGQELLAALCSVANPVEHTFCADGRLAAHLAGNRELVALLWRYGAATNAVPVTNTNTNTNGQTIQ